MQYNPMTEHTGLSFHALAHMEKAAFAQNHCTTGKAKAEAISSPDFSKNGVIILESW